MIELSEIVQNKHRLALLLESPEPLDWTRLTALMSILNSASNTYLIQSGIKVFWSGDGTRALVVSDSGAPILAGAYRLNITYALDLGAEVPLLRRSGSSLPETAALQFNLA